MQGVFIIEQPSSSLFFHDIYMRAAFRMLLKAGEKVGFCPNSFLVNNPPKALLVLTKPRPCQLKQIIMWMQLFGGSSPKRTMLVGNRKMLRDLQTGRLIRALHKSSVATATKYIDRQGVLRYKGTSQLKSTQTHDTVQFNKL